MVSAQNVSIERSPHISRFSTVEVVQYIGGIASVLWGIASVLWGIASVQWGIASVLWGDSFSTVEVIQYSGGITSVHAGDNISSVGDNISTLEGYLQYCGG